MQEKQIDNIQPAPRQALGHPIVRQEHHESSDHKPGYEEARNIPRGRARAKKGKVSGAILPPRKASKLPKTSISERIRERLSQKEQDS